MYLSQDEAGLDMRVRDAASHWQDETIDRPDAILDLPELGVRVPVAEIYEDTDIARGIAAGDRPG